MKQGLTEIIKELEEAQVDCLYDIQQDWNEEKEFMAFQLKILTEAIGLLNILSLSPSSQLFKSSMKL